MNEFEIKRGFISKGDSIVSGLTTTESIKIITGAVNNYVLTSDSGGTGTWTSVGSLPGATADTFTNAANLSGNSITFNDNVGGTNVYNVDILPLLSGKTDNSTFNGHTGDTSAHANFYTTGFTYTPSTNTLTINDSTGGTLTSNILTMSGLSITNGLTIGTTLDIQSGKVNVDTDGVLNVGSGMTMFSFDGTSDPTISYSGTTGGTINLEVQPDGKLNWVGNDGVLFSIEDDLSDLLFSVNDISGLPVFEVYADDRVIMGAVGTNALVVDTDQVFVGTSGETTLTNTKLYVSGGTEFEGDVLIKTGHTFTYENGAQNNYILVSDPSGVATWQDAATLPSLTADTFVTGTTFNGGTYDFSVELNDGNTYTENLGILSSDMVVTGGTYNINTGVVAFTNNSGGTFNVTGFTSGMTDSFTTTASTSGTEIQFDNNVQGSNYFNVDIEPIVTSIIGITSTGIYGGSGSLVSATTVTQGTNDLTFSTTANASSLKVKASNGFVGVGIVSPTANLQVSGTTLLNGNLTVSTGGLDVTAGDLDIIAGEINGSSNFNSGGVARMSFAGTIAQFHHASHGGGLAALRQLGDGRTIIEGRGGSGNNYDIYLESTNGFALLSQSGNFGINVAAPTADLHVNGATTLNTATASVVGEVWTATGTGGEGEWGVNLNGIYGGSGNLTSATTITQAGNDLTFSTSADSNTFKVYSDGTVGVKTTGATSFDLEVNGSFGATSKSFVIDHPTKEDKKLVHGSLEGPEFGVYVRGKVHGNVIELPEYWKGLVDEDTITVQLTAMKVKQDLFVKEIKDNRVYINEAMCYYTIYGERKDIDKIILEIDK